MHRNQAIPLDGMETGMGLRTVRSFPYRNQAIPLDGMETPHRCAMLLSHCPRYRNQAIPLDGMETWGTLPVPSHIFL